MDDNYCIDCCAETFHENRLCSECYDRRFNDPARELPNGERRVLGDPPNPPVPPVSASHRARLVLTFWDAVLSGVAYQVRRAAHGLMDRGVSLERTVREHLTRLEDPAQRMMREEALAVFSPYQSPA